MFAFLIQAVRQAEDSVDKFRRRYIRKSPEVLVGYPQPRLMADFERFSEAGRFGRFRIAWRIANEMASYETEMERCSHFYRADFRLTGTIEPVDGKPEVFRMKVEGLHDGQDHYLYFWWDPVWSVFDTFECGEPVAAYFVNDERNSGIPAGVALRLHAVEQPPQVNYTGLHDLRIARRFMSSQSPQDQSGGSHAEL